MLVKTVRRLAACGKREISSAGGGALPAIAGCCVRPRARPNLACVWAPGARQLSAAATAWPKWPCLMREKREERQEAASGGPNRQARSWALTYEQERQGGVQAGPTGRLAAAMVPEPQGWVPRGEPTLAG